jgi:hypothetical protein
MALATVHHLSYRLATPIALPTASLYKVTIFSGKVTPEDGGSQLHRNVDNYQMTQTSVFLF